MNVCTTVIHTYIHTYIQEYFLKIKKREGAAANGQFHGDGRTILTFYSSICVTMMIDKVWLETSNIRVYERHPVIHLTKGAGYLAWFKVAI